MRRDPAETVLVLLLALVLAVAMVLLDVATRATDGGELRAPSEETVERASRALDDDRRWRPVIVQLDGGAR